MMIARDDYLKIGVWWETNQNFDSKTFKSIKGNFYDGENKQIFGCWAGYFPIPVFFIQVQGKGEQLTPGGVQQFCHIFGNKCDAWRMILEDNSAGHGFVLRDLVLIELFQISHNCVTECTRT